jgi:hypothetical protein
MPQEIVGYYVLASDINDGSKCTQKDWTDAEILEGQQQPPEPRAGQMRVLANSIEYKGIALHGGCDITGISRPRARGGKPSEYVGPWLRPRDRVYEVQATCFDEGEKSRKRLMFRSVRLGAGKVLLDTDLQSGVTEIWAYCSGKS